MSATALDHAEHKGISLMLAIAMHGVIAAFLFFGVQWQTKPVAPTQVELWAGALEPMPVEAIPPPPPPKPAPTPVEELPPPPKAPDIQLEKPKPTPKVKPKPEPPKPTPTPTPKLLPKPEKKVEPTPKPLPKPEKKVEPLPVPSTGKQASELAGKMTAPPLDATASLAALAARQQAAEAGAKSGLWEAYYAQVRNKIRRNMTYPEEAGANPEVTLEVKLLPDMSVMDVTVVKSSGISAFDDAAVRAVKRTEQYPPIPAGLDKAELRRHKLNYRLKDGR